MNLVHWLSGPTKNTVHSDDSRMRSWTDFCTQSYMPASIPFSWTDCFAGQVGSGGFPPWGSSSRWQNKNKPVCISKQQWVPIIWRRHAAKLSSPVNAFDKSAREKRLIGPKGIWMVAQERRLSRIYLSFVRLLKRQSTVVVFVTWTGTWKLKKKPLGVHLQCDRVNMKEIFGGI